MGVARARALRKKSTDAERFLWRRLRRKLLFGHSFRRQAPIGEFIVDFVCFGKKLVVELDGGQHARQADYDSARTAWLQAEGFRVLRFWNHEVMKETDVVVATIGRALHGD